MINKPTKANQRRTSGHVDWEFLGIMALMIAILVVPPIGAVIASRNQPEIHSEGVLKLYKTKQGGHSFLVDDRGRFAHDPDCHCGNKPLIENK
jgi:hypothetical protein